MILAEQRAVRVRLTVRQAFVRRFGWVFVFLLLSAVPAVVLSSSYLLTVFVSAAIYGIVLVGLDLQFGYGRLYSFGHNGFFALGAFVMGVLSARLGVPLLVGAIAGLALNLLLAFIIGGVTLRLKDYYFSVATLGFGIIVIQVLGGLVDLTGGWSGLTGVAQPAPFGIALVSDLQFYAIAIVGLLLALAVSRRLVDSRFGRALRAVGNDEVAAATVGIPVARTKIQVFMVTSVFASLAGSLFGLFLRVVTPANFDVPIMIEMVLMLFLGGKETLWGPILGALLLRLAPEYLGPLKDFRSMFEGAAFLLILLFLPSGLAGMLRRGWGSFSARLLATPTSAVDQGPLDLSPAVPAIQVVRDATPRSEGELLRIEGLTKTFRGVRAVSNLSFGVRASQLKGIIGPNGAGKTTLFNLLAGVMVPDAGQVWFAGREITGLPTQTIASLGLTRTFQTPRLFSSMTVLENVLAGQHTRLKSGLGQTVLGLHAAEEAEALARAWTLLDLVGLRQRARVVASELSFGEQRLLEIARGLAVSPRLLLLDEPAAGLNEAEKDRLGDVLLELRDAGLTLLLVEHDMRLVMRVADELLVMNYGERVTEGTPREIQQHEAVLDVYLGTDATRPLQPLRS